MSDHSEPQDSEQPQPRGWEALKQHVIDHKVEVALWATRVFTIIFTFGYFIPLLGNPYNAYYKALISNAATSALRLHQRIPRVTLSREFLSLLLLEDSCHYLFYSLIFLYVTPVTLVLLPVFLFAVLHSASYSLTLLDTLGQNSWWGARLLISLVEFQSRNILRLVAFTEIFLVPFTVVLIFMGRASLLTPFIYYHFLTLRYSSRRNPYTRNMFYELRVLLEGTARKPGIPSFLRNILLSVISLASKLAPPQQTQQ
ncbi:Krueppel homolog 2 [Zootermopsis nevadensis]|uniref:Protein Kr-h2 n=1 Tax=Zootermopsis nevadensis TaxID=136037 RepID=A0A067R3Y8_ZOONE|nr:Krueppel homolog 2 [Zootermopsis nevadensis]XP_021924773.1 Krueppel homolog 2 [Zootermopsis nevadensis]KDR16814.1 Protein Kr-h2 [Zootermopsis nevadensis]